MTGVTQILASIQQGDPHAAEQLLPLVYEVLRKLAAARMAGESPDHTLQATAPGGELWRSDGTPAGTVMVAFFNSGSAWSGPRNLTNMSRTRMET